MGEIETKWTFAYPFSMIRWNKVGILLALGKHLRNYVPYNSTNVRKTSSLKLNLFIFFLQRDCSTKKKKYLQTDCWLDQAVQMAMNLNLVATKERLFSIRKVRFWEIDNGTKQLFARRCNIWGKAQESQWHKGTVIFDLRQ